MSKQPTHEDWAKAKAEREAAAMRCVRALIAGKKDAAMQAALEAEARDDLMWSISQFLDGPGEGK